MNLKRSLWKILIASILTMLTLTACSDGANSSFWRNSVNQNEQSIEGGFIIYVGSATSGQRNRTFDLSADELNAIRVNSISEAGKITLVVSNDGKEDGTEVELDISNYSGNLAR